MTKNILLSVFAIAVLCLGFGCSTAEAPIDNTKIKWYTIEEALAAHGKKKKKIFIDFYTDWCGWCKVMDKKTFTEAEVIKYMNANYYAVKFDAEQMEDVAFKGQTYKFQPGGRKGVHLFAYHLLKEKLGYPAFVVLDENLNKEQVLNGFKPADAFLAELQPK